MKRRIISYHLIRICGWLWGILAVCLAVTGGLKVLSYRADSIWRQFTCILIGASIVILGGGVLYKSGQEIYKLLHFVWPDEQGIRYKILWKTVQYFNWSEIQEWGVGTQCCSEAKDYRVLPTGEERFLKMLPKDIGKKYIYFSVYGLSREEKERLLTESNRCEGLLIMEYSKKIYQEIFNINKKGFCPKKQENHIEIKSEENTKKQTVSKKQMLCCADLKKGILILWFLSGAGAGWTLIPETCSVWSIGILILYMILLVGVVARYLRPVIVNEDGITYRDKFFRKIFWKWDEIYECAVLRDGYITTMYVKGYTRKDYYEDRYIYFTKREFIYKEAEESFVRQYFKMEDIVMVKYSEELYWYLKKLGVLGIKEQ